MPKDKSPFDLENRLIEFAVRVIKLAEALPKSNVGKHLSGQLIRCGKSPAPNYGEAQGAESRSDFIHKMKVCLKELRETKVWLKMIIKAELINPVTKLDTLLAESDQLIAIFVKSIETAKNNRR